MAKGCVYILQTGKDAGKVFGSKESLAAHMNYTPAMADLMAKYQQAGGAMDVGNVTKWLTENGYIKTQAAKPVAPAAPTTAKEVTPEVKQPEIAKDIYVGSITQTSGGWESATKDKGPGDMRQLGYKAASGVEVAKGEDGKTYAVAFTTKSSDGKRSLQDKSGRPGFKSLIKSLLFILYRGFKFVSLPS
jgi:hypothetical protein